MPRRLKALSFATVWLLVRPAFAEPASYSAPAEPRYLVVRYDDYAPVDLRSGRERSIELDRRLFALFSRHHAKLVVGVTPFPVAHEASAEIDPGQAQPEGSWLSDPGNEWVVLLRSYSDGGTIEIALHGFEHRRRPANGAYRHGEFRLQPLEWQRSALASGCSVLSAALDRPIHAFIPPWNAWDANTAAALDQSGFLWLSADAHHAELPASQLRVVPQSTADPGAARGCVEGHCDTPPGTVLVLVLHPFDLDGPEAPVLWQDLDRLLYAVGQSSTWRSAAFSDLPAGSANAWQERFRAAVAWHHDNHRLADMIGGPFLGDSDLPVLRPSGWYAERLNRQRFWLAAVLGISAACGAWGGYRLAWSLRNRPLLLGLGCIAILGAITILIAGAVAIHNQGYLVRGVRYQAICAAAGWALAYMATMMVHRGPRAGFAGFSARCTGAAPVSPVSLPS